MLLDQSMRARQALASGDRNSKLLSKYPPGLVPESFDPNDAILVSLGRKFGYAGQGSFRFLDDVPMPYAGASIGPNGVLTECQAKPYGPNRINLFDQTIERTTDLLIDFIGARNRTQIELLGKFSSKLQSHIDSDYLIKTCLLYTSPSPRD